MASRSPAAIARSVWTCRTASATSCNSVVGHRSQRSPSARSGSCIVPRMVGTVRNGRPRVPIPTDRSPNHLGVSHREDQGRDPVGSQCSVERRGDRARSTRAGGGARRSSTRPGMCHSDEHLVTGDLPFALPIVGGHEGAGVVQEVGEGVSWLSRATTSCSGSSRRAGAASRARPGTRTCATSAPLFGTGMQITDGTARHTRQGKDLGLMCLLGTFPTTRSSTRRAASRSRRTCRSTGRACSAAAS